MPRANTSIQLQLWKERLEQFSQSGQSVQKYCEAAGCTPASFYYWKRKVATASQAGVSLPASQRGQANGDSRQTGTVHFVTADGQIRQVIYTRSDGNCCRN